MDSLIDYIRKQGFNQTQAAEHFGVKQGRISYLRRTKAKFAAACPLRTRL